MYSNYFKSRFKIKFERPRNSCKNCFELTERCWTVLVNNIEKLDEWTVLSEENNSESWDTSWKAQMTAKGPKNGKSDWQKEGLLYEREVDFLKTWVWNFLSLQYTFYLNQRMVRHIPKNLEDTGKWEYRALLTSCFPTQRWSFSQHRKFNSNGRQTGSRDN